MFLAYLRGIETPEWSRNRLPKSQFLAYLRGIETGNGMSSSITSKSVFSLPKRD
ncbi:hypothetical protein TTE2648 [Caldanaerobacter subterraneus subsp. tengcongensis MB4]|uniref:Uncharacterized protein n=1 Tax=Caldanaerobacter subterraneus subsp. tengcongensis (strain DSM 15242 / JCM 11007 / NBRC 100824 / MB4) TaxID=273068 RepID=Q8R6Y5_CALS4|nr:hypothetical protein TTE2648 [Caldanaerobacter subterraneus subsp. tengcongensis MB4]